MGLHAAERPSQFRSQQVILVFLQLLVRWCEKFVESHVEQLFEIAVQVARLLCTVSNDLYHFRAEAYCNGRYLGNGDHQLFGTFARQSDKYALNAVEHPSVDSDFVAHRQLYFFRFIIGEVFLYVLRQSDEILHLSGGNPHQLAICSRTNRSDEYLKGRICRILLEVCYSGVGKQQAVDGSRRDFFPMTVLISYFMGT